MAITSNLLAAMVRGAVDKAQRDGTTPAEVLKCIVLGKFESEMTNGRTVISVAEAGGSTTFQLLSGLEPQAVAALATEALSWIEQQEDPVNPDLSGLRRVTRLRGVFDSGNIPL